MSENNSPSKLKKLSIEIFHKAPSIQKLSFFILPKPARTDHILIRLRYKNDTSYRMLAILENNIPFHQEFRDKESIFYMLPFLMTMYAAEGLQELTHLFKKQYEIPDQWKEMQEVQFPRSDLQKYINLK